MKVYRFERETRIARPLAEVFEFFSYAGNLERITPPWVGFHILTPEPIEMKPGALLTYKLRLRGIPIRWVTEIVKWDPPFEFVDVQKKGPYALWRHTHRFREENGATAMTDTVEYALPFGILGQIVNRLQVARDVATIFEYRARQIEAIFS